MAEKASGPAEPLDVQRIHYLVRLMKRYDLTALDVLDGPVQIRLRRSHPSAGTVAAVAAPVAQPVLAPAVAAAPLPAATVPAAVAVAGPETVVIESPMVGTYYSSSSPDVPPFVNVGSVIRRDTIVCLIEAMKVFTEIPAEVSGTISEILVKNGQAVEYGQPMFRVVPG